MFLQPQERLEDLPRLALEEPRVADLEVHVDDLEVVVEDRDAAVGSRRDVVEEVREQDLVEAPDRLGREVVVAHEQARRRHRAGGVEFGLSWEADLVVEDEAVLAPRRQVMQADAKALEHALVGGDVVRFRGRDDPRLGELAPRSADSRGAREPQDHLQVAQPPGAFLDVRLEVVGGVHEAIVAALLLAEFRLEVVAHVALRVESRGELREERSVAGDQPRLEQARIDRHVLRRLVDAFGDRAHAVPGLEPAVPQRADQALDARARLLAVGQQHQQADVRMGKEQSAAVAANGDERDAVALDVIGPEVLQDGIDEARVGGERAVRVGSLVVARLELFAPVADPGAHHGAARAGRDFPRRKSRNRVVHPYETWCAADRSTKDGGGGDPRERVSTSKPSSVTRMVCSHWAEREWSAVTIVQPSPSWRMSRLPALIIGSIVKVIPASRFWPWLARP